METGVVWLKIYILSRLLFQPFIIVHFQQISSGKTLDEHLKHQRSSNLIRRQSRESEKAFEWFETFSIITQRQTRRVSEATVYSKWISECALSNGIGVGGCGDYSNKSFDAFSRDTKYRLYRNETLRNLKEMTWNIYKQRHEVMGAPERSALRIINGGKRFVVLVA